MTIIVHNTEKMVSINGVPARVWEGKTESGIPIHCYITRLAVAEDADTAQFDKELQSCTPMSAEVRALPARLVL